MASIQIIDQNGVVTKREVVSSGASVAGDPDDLGELDPSVVQQVKFDNKGQMTSLTTECGETENRRESNKKPNITVEGIIVEDEISEMRALKQQDEVTLISDIYDGEVIVERLSITQKSDLLYYIPDGGEKQLAFSFQIQLKVP